jgi:sigma-70, region 4
MNTINNKSTETVGGKLAGYRLVGIRLDVVNSWIDKLEDWGKIADTTEYLKQAYAERDELEAEQQSIVNAIKNIPNERYRIMFYLYYIKGYTKRAIAEQLGITDRYLYRLWSKAQKEYVHE